MFWGWGEELSHGPTNDKKENKRIKTKNLRGNVQTPWVRGNDTHYPTNEKKNKMIKKFQLNITILKKNSKFKG